MSEERLAEIRSYIPEDYVCGCDDSGGSCSTYDHIEELLDALRAEREALEQAEAKVAALSDHLRVCLRTLRKDFDQDGEDYWHTALAANKNISAAAFELLEKARKWDALQSRLLYDDVCLVANFMKEQISLRHDDGSRLTIQWGERDAEGLFNPTVTRHPDDNPLRELLEKARKWDEWAPYIRMRETSKQEHPGMCCDRCEEERDALRKRVEELEASASEKGHQ